MAKHKPFPFALGENSADAIKRLNDSKRNRARGFGQDSKQQKTLEFTDNDMSIEQQKGSTTEANETPATKPAATKSFANHQISVDNLDTQSVQKVELTHQQLKDLIESHVLKQADRDSAVITKVQAKLAEKEGDVELLQERLDALERDYQAKLEKSKQEANNLFRVFSDLGVSVTESGDIVKDTDPLYFGSSEIDKKTVLAGVNESHARSRNSRITHSGMDAFKEATRIFRDQTPKLVLAHPMTGALVDVYDTSAIDSFVKANRRQCITGLDSQLKKEGFLRGRAVDSSTSQLTMPPMYLEMLSSLLRVTHMSQFVMHQFADTIPALGYNVGDTVQIPRSDFGAVSNNAEDWELDLGSPLADNSQPLMMGHVKAVLKEYGMGKTNTTMLPIAIPQFIMSTSLHQLLQIVQTNLGRNYREFEELLLRRLWEGTSLIRYNVHNGVSDSAPSTTGQKGGLTREFLISLAAYMHGDLKVPTFDDGNYVLVTNSLSLAVLKNSIGENSRFIDKRSIEELTNLFNFSTGSDLGRIYGYQMTVGNFHIFSQNSYGVGAIEGEQYGVSKQNETIFRSSFAVGRNTIGRAIAKPFSIIRSSNDDFGRMNRYSWGSYEAFAQLDVDPNQGTPESANQQARVVEIRTSDIIL